MTASESSVKIGSLFIITCMGGTIGRAEEDGSVVPHDVPLDDIGCSKYHAKVSCTGGKFFLADLGGDAIEKFFGLSFGLKNGLRFRFDSEACLN